MLGAGTAFALPAADAPQEHPYFRFQYDPYGSMIGGNSAQAAYLYSGEQFDPETQNYYNRARYYSPKQGRFISMDSWAGNINKPITLNKYLYADGNPVMGVDPSGRWSLQELMISMAVGGIINSIAEWDASASVGSHAANFFVGALEGAVGYGALGLAFSGFARFANLAKFAKFEKVVDKVFAKCLNAGPEYAGTMLPTYFQLSTKIGNVFINPNATKHMFEILKHTSRSATKAGSQSSAAEGKLASSMLLKEIQEAVEYAAKNGLIQESIQTGETVVVKSSGITWEFAFVTEKKYIEGLAQFVLKHAQILSY